MSYLETLYILAKSKENSKHIIQKIKNTFNDVNRKIDGLLDCSVKDFVLLNTSFKKHHKLLDDLSKSANGFLDFIQSSQEDLLIESYCNKLKETTTTLRQTIKKQTSELKELYNKYNYATLIINNLKQDLSTLHLLFTNLRFDPSFNSDKQKVESCLENLSNCYRNCEDNINKLCDDLISIIEFSEDGFINGIDRYIDLLDQLIAKSSRINAVRKASVKYKKQILKIEEKKADSTSEIITNLQFQDILRQKIEHIQEAHEQITNNLFSEHKDGDELKSQELYQIRDISSLQSAQLIHANQEYQNAVEIILQKINVLKQVVNNYNSIWNQFCVPEISKLKSILTGANSDFSTLNDQSFSLRQVSDKYQQLITNIANYKVEINNQLRESVCGCNGINVLKEIIDSASLNRNDNDKYSPIPQLENELIKFEQGYTKLNTLIKSLEKENIPEFIQDLQKSDLNTQSIDSNYNKIINLINEFNQSTENNILRPEKNEISADYSIEKVTYYKTFEKEVKEIILLLDHLLESINFKKSDIKPGQLDHLRDMYTMQSERDVHDLITNKAKKKDKKDNKKDNNEIEFF